MLKVVIKTATPNWCRKIHGNGVMILKQIWLDKEGRVKALASLKSMNGCRDVIIRDHECELAKTILGSGAMVVLAQVRKDGILWTLVCTWEEFKTLMNSLNNLNLGYELIWKSSFFEKRNELSYELSYKELEILRLALEYGYFENPKKIKLRDLAKMLGVSEATASDLIRRALKKSLKNVFTHLY